MTSLVESGAGEAVAVADASEELARDAASVAPGAAACSSLEELLEHELDGVVIATPSSLHADQTQHCLERGLAVFCQKPLGRSARETAAVIEAARAADRLLGVDLSYRFVRGAQKMRSSIQAGEIGEVYAAEMIFHNAYGPDKPWFLDPRLSGGGCVIDLGTHLVDLALWALDDPEVESVHSSLFSQGSRTFDASAQVEDHALAELELVSGTVIRLACSWFLDAGQDAVIEATFFGRDGSLSMQNVDGSFYDFITRLHRGTSSELLDEPPDGWGGRALVRWAQQLGHDPSFDPAIGGVHEVARVIDRIYGRSA